MKRFLPLILAALLLLAALPAAALDLGKLTLAVQPVDYVSALAGIAKPVSKTYAANERYAVAVTVQVPQYYDVTNMQVVAEPANCTVETGDIQLATGTYLVTGTVLAPGASLTVTFRDEALYTASSAQDLYQALQMTGRSRRRRPWARPIRKNLPTSRILTASRRPETGRAWLAWC